MNRPHHKAGPRLLLIKFRVNEYERDLIASIAAEAGVPVSEWARARATMAPTTAEIIAARTSTRAAADAAETAAGIAARDAALTAANAARDAADAAAHAAYTAADAAETASAAVAGLYRSTDASL